MDELAIAQQQIQAKRAHGLKALLPSALPGWTLSVNTNMNAGIALAGGGVGVEGDYEGGNQSFKNHCHGQQCHGGLDGADAGQCDAGGTDGQDHQGRQGEVCRPGRAADRLVGQQVIVQAEGAPEKVMVPVLEKMDFNAVSKFGS